MSFSIVRGSASGLSRYCSFWLLSAFLVLLGGYLSLYADPTHTPADAISDVFRTQLLYQLALVLVLALIYRTRGEIEDTVALLGILGVFMADGLLVQHRSGWAPGDGLTTAQIGLASALVLGVAAALAVELPLWSRLFTTVLATVAFIRLGPTLLIDAPGTADLSPRYVALGWLLAACTLPLFLAPRTERGGSRLPLRSIERWGIVGCLGLALLHFVPAGRSFDLRFSIAYLAPLVVVLAPLLEHLLPGHQRLAPLRRLIGGLPYLGLALAAAEFPPGLVAGDWARQWPLTPFYLVLLLATVVQLWRAWYKRDVVLAHVAALLASMACLAGDVPEILIRARYPSGWQVIAVSGVAWSVIIGFRHLTAGKLLLAVPAFVGSSWLAEQGYPWTVAWLIALGLSALAIERLTGWQISPIARLLVVVASALLPVVTMLQQHDDDVRRIVAATVLLAMFVAGLFTRDRLLRQAIPLVVAGGCAAFPFVIQQYGEVSTGRLVTQLGFLMLLTGLLNAVIGNRVREQWQEWWEQEARPVLAGARADAD